MEHALPDMGLQLVKPEPQAKPEMATPKQLASFVSESVAAMETENWTDVVKEQVPWQ